MPIPSGCPHLVVDAGELPSEGRRRLALLCQLPTELQQPQQLLIRVRYQPQRLPPQRLQAAESAHLLAMRACALIQEARRRAGMGFAGTLLACED